MIRSAAWRSHSCGDLRAENVGQEVTLCGWVDNRRNHGAVHFVDLRDRYGITQLVVDGECESAASAQMADLHQEDVVQAKGVVRMRIEGQRNSDRITGDVEVLVSSVEILSRSKTLPFEIADHIDVPEDIRLKYRYLDMRRSPLQRALQLRSKANNAIRNSLCTQEFVEVETPMLTRSTPEGARDYLVPSRMRPGSWFALPQSPQIFKQLCMVGGLDRYYQIARCMRDEDLRADRQPEFTQLDLEMSFVDEEDVYAAVERLMQEVYQAVHETELTAPFERMPYSDAIEFYASDKPDLRNPLKIIDVADVAGDLDFVVFNNVLESKGWVRAINVPGGASLSRKQIDNIERLAKESGAGGAAWCKVSADGPTGPLSRFLKSDAGASFIAKVGAADGDLIFTIADTPRRALVALDVVRRESASAMNLVSSEDRIVWITEFPLFEQNDDGSYHPAHHPFTCPVADDLELLRDGQKEGIRSRAYDLVLNGVELGSGSIRIHDKNLQSEIFDAIGLPPEVAAERFEFLLQAFNYGAPPHAGFAIGLDRLYSIMFEADSIRDVIAFPKTATSACPLTSAPSAVDSKQLEELGIKQQIETEQEVKS
ncbi:MAG: aspartate--tRNA ligase [Planctomycetes bacterium]|nr:aspartate--tRNA ligase [Planctomycetota bacterium]